ncbi:hypothetical protein F5Y19DRAFT_173137 [Xylariaceae sp. FL1651]|nr:hypothetical protein F5Y19DRAFT_173137 [Xylariaceae sp. FL1651]
MGSAQPGGHVGDWNGATGPSSHQPVIQSSTRLPIQPWNRINYPRVCDSSREYMLSTCTQPRGGIASLVDMCTIVIAKHINELEKEHLQYIPGPLVGRIWECVKTISGELSLESWKLLATKISGDEVAAKYLCSHLMKHSISIPRPQHLGQYLTPLNSTTFDFLTHLIIAGGVSFDTHELLQLVQLKNLAVFEIIQPYRQLDTFPRLTDSIIREWSQQQNPFPVLRVMKVWGNDFTTVKSVRYLSSFPSLVLYDVAGRKTDWSGKHDDTIWKRERGTYTTNLRCTLSEQSKSLEENTHLNRWEIDPWARLPNISDLIFTMCGPASKVTLIQRPDQRMYEALLQVPKTRYTRSLLSMEELPIRASNDDIWGFLLYCHIGRLLSDQDLLSQGIKVGERVFSLNQVVLPPRPTVSLTFGHAPHEHRYDWEHACCVKCSVMPVSGRYAELFTPISPRRRWSQRRNLTLDSEERASFQIHSAFVRNCPCHEKEDISHPNTKDGETTKRKQLKRRRDVAGILESFNKG